MSPRGIALAGLGAAAIVTGVVLGWIEIVSIGAALIVLAFASLLLRFPRSASWWDVSAPRRVTRGDAAAVVVGVTIADRSSTWVSADDDAGSARAWLPAGQRTAELTWPVDTSRRGLFDAGPSRLEAGDPFGLRRRILATREPSPILVVPRVRAIPADAEGMRGEDGDSAERAGSDQFHSLREYVVGDPMKTVHWRSSARAGKLMVRRMVDTTIPWVMVVLDVNARAYDREAAIFEDFDPDAFEESVDTAASWAWWACGPQQRVLLTTTATMATSAEVTAGTRESALDMLALVSPEPADLCAPGRVEALSRRQGIGRIVLVTGRRTETSTAWIASWRRVVPVTVVVGHA